MAEGVSLLYSQLGYYPLGEKQALLRAREDFSQNALAGQSFVLCNQQGEEAYRGEIRYWGQLWRSHWWVLDFSDYSVCGTYRLSAAGQSSAAFQIHPAVLSRQGLKTIALDQLDERREHGVLGWRDCGSKIRELSSMVITLLALMDLWENPALLESAREELLSDILFGVETILASQESWPDDQERDGRFNHDAFRMTKYGTTDYHNWHDTAYALTALARAYPLLKLSHPALARACLAACEKAFGNATRRPYHLESDFAARTHPEIHYEDDFADLVHSLGANMYDKPSGWKMPSTLRTKEKLTFAWACCLLHEATGQQEYLDAAVKYATSACRRQCRAARGKARDGIGFFYEFEDDNEAFMLEFGHSHKFHMGNIEPCNLAGLMYLTKLLPMSPHAPLWLHTIHAYAKGYVKAVTAKNPFSIYPQTVYANPVYGGACFFGIAVHGFTCLYGQIAKNLFELSAFVQDAELARLAERNLMFAVGRNPGFPDQVDATRWKCTSLIKGVGSESFGGKHELSVVPDGSAMNGFAMTQFSNELRLGDIPDEPLGILKPDGTYFFNEDYLPHSHGYVSGVAQREKPFLLTLSAREGLCPVPAKVLLQEGNKTLANQALGPDGSARAFLEPMSWATVTLTWKGSVWHQAVFAAPGGSLHIAVDFVKCLSVCADAPLSVAPGQSAAIRLHVKNLGIDKVEDIIRLAGDGVMLPDPEISIRLDPGEEKTYPVAFTAPSFSTLYAICLLPQASGQPIQLLCKGTVGETVTEAE